MLIDVKDFAGEAPAIYPESMAIGIATYALDCDLSLGSLKPFQTDRKVSDKTGDVIWSDDCCYLTFDCNTTVAQANIGCKFVFVAGNGQPKYASYEDACNDVWCRMDFPCSLPAPTISSLTPVVKSVEYERVSVVYTLKNKHGHESQPSMPSEVIDMQDMGMMAASGLPTNDDGFCWEKVCIYATRGQYAIAGQKQTSANGFFLIAEIDFGAASTVAQFGRPGKKCMTDDADPIPSDVWDICHERSGHLSALSNNMLRFSERMQWTSWPEDYAMNVPGTALRHLAGREWGYVLTDERYLAVQLDLNCKGTRCHISKESKEVIPIISHRSACMWGDMALWATHEGLVMALGAESKIVSRPWFDAKAWQEIRPDTLFGVVHKGHYFGKTENYCFRLALPNSYHAEHKDLGALTRLSINPTAFYETRDGTLLFATADGIYEWSKGDDFKPYVWERKHWKAPAHVGFSTWKVDFRYGSPSKVATYAGNKQIQSLSAPISKESTKLPICKNAHWGVRLEGTSEITRYRLGTSIHEIQA